jgi:hypothetical protein
MLKTMLIAAVAATAALAGVSAANAADGCGRGMHRTPRGYCRPNARPAPAVVLPGGLVIGSYYAGRGYWDGRRYWAHRDRWHNGWRYR